LSRCFVGVSKQGSHEAQWLWHVMWWLVTIMWSICTVLMVISRCCKKLFFYLNIKHVRRALRKNNYKWMVTETLVKVIDFCCSV
jgi:hypothetical protein